MLIATMHGVVGNAHDFGFYCKRSSSEFKFERERERKIRIIGYEKGSWNERKNGFVRSLFRLNHIVVCLLLWVNFISFSFSSFRRMRVCVFVYRHEPLPSSSDLIIILSLYSIDYFSAVLFIFMKIQSTKIMAIVMSVIHLHLNVQTKQERKKKSTVYVSLKCRATPAVAIIVWSVCEIQDTWKTHSRRIHVPSEWDDRGATDTSMKFVMIFSFVSFCVQSIYLKMSKTWIALCFVHFHLKYFDKTINAVRSNALWISHSI